MRETPTSDLLGDVDPAFAEAVLARLEAIEKRLVAEAHSDNPFVDAVSRHIIDAGGKRFRPLLVVLGAALGEEPDPDFVERAALVVELTHVGSLYHDDVMDEAELRRGIDSANARWGNSVAILVGDLLFSRGSHVVATLGADFVALQAETFARLVHGQIAETVGPDAGEDALEHYLRVVADKTGSLIATSARFGGMVAGLDKESLDALGRFGEEIGIVFQLSDDVIDIMSDSSGKNPGADLRAGVPTLPTLLAARSTRPEDAHLKQMLAAPIESDAAVLEALALLRHHPALGEARAEIVRRAELARGYLAALPDCDAKGALSTLCDVVVTRTA